MGIFNNDLEIDIENPFKNDKLHREEEVKNLTAMFDIVDNQMVLAINSQWGTGKTSFLRMWNQHLINQGYKTIFFNAWENDFVDDPFIAFVDEIRDSINDENKVRGLIEKAKDVSLALFKQTPKMASKIIKEKTGFDSEEIISNDELAKSVADKIDSYNKNKKSVNKFKIELEKIANKEFEENKKTMIIFVDELDRCRPDYAISLLERIKHFFNVQNIIFILGIDKEALSNSIRVIYGEQTDINGYLTRFIDIEYKLNDIAKVDYIEFIMGKYNFKEIYSERKFYDYDEEGNYEEFKNILKEYFLAFNLTLRDIEKITVNILMILKARGNKLIYPYPLLFLCILKRLDNSLYLMIKSKQIGYNEIMKLMNNSESIMNWFEDYSLRGYVVKAFIIWLVDDKKEVELLKEKIEREDNKSYYNSKKLCVECFERIDKRVGYNINTRKVIFDEVELYQNVTTIN